MSFLAPFYLGFVALIGVPLFIHLFGRERAKPIRFAAMELLLGAQQQVAQRNRIRRWLLLLTRALLIAAIPLVLAQPFWLTPSDSVAVGGTQSAVIVVDTSASMGYTDGGETRLQAAKARAQQLVEALGGESEVALLAGARDMETSASELVRDRSRLARAIDSLRISDGATDLVGAARRANQLLQNAARARRVIYLISDFQTGALPSTGMPQLASELVLVDVGSKTPQNHAITELQIEPAPELGARAVRISVAMQAFGKPERNVPLIVRIDGQPIAQSNVDLDIAGPSPIVRRKFTHVFADTSVAGATILGAHDLVAELPPDALPIDDRRYAHVVIDRSVRVLLVDGDSRTQRREDELFYVETAVHAAGGLEATTVEAEQVTAERLASVDVLVLCNVRAPNRALLTPFVERGGGLVIALGSNVDADAYNAALGDLLPQLLQSIRTVGFTRDARHDGEVVQPTSALNAARIGHVDHTHAIIAGLAEAHLDEELHAAQFGRYAVLRASGAGEPRAILSFDDSAPLLVEKRVGKGAVLLFGSTLDRDWNNLSIQPLYLPLVQRALLYLGRVAQSSAQSSILVGQSVELALPENTTEVEIKPPTQASSKLHAPDIGNFHATNEVGLYQVATRVAESKLTPRAELGFAVNVDARESDLSPMAPAEREALQRRPDGSVRETPKRRVELWHTLGALVLALLLAESLLVRRK